MTFNNRWFRWPLWKKSGMDFLDHDGLETAGYLAYTVLVSLFPFLIFLFSIASLFSGDAAMNQLVDQGFALMPAQVTDVTVPVVRDVLSHPRPGLLTVGLIGALWAAASGVDALRHGLNRAYALKETRPWWRRKLASIIAVGVSAITGILVAMGLILMPVILKFANEWFYLPVDTLMQFAPIRYAFGFAILSVVFWSMYRFLPSPQNEHRLAWPGAFMAAFLWTLLAAGFSLYLSYFNNYSATYGSLGGVVMTLLFLQLSAAILLFGAEYNMHANPKPKAVAAA